MFQGITRRFSTDIVLEFAAAAALIVVTLNFASPGHAASKVDPSAAPPADGLATAAEQGSFDRNGDRISDTLMARIAAGSPADLVEVVVTFNEPRSAASAMAQAGPFEVEREFTLINGFAATMRGGQVQALAASPSVFRIDENFEMQAVLESANADTGAADARAAFGVDGTGVTICVVDTGLEISHEQFDSKGIGPADFFDAVSGLGVPYDDNFHGTHVAGIAAGDGNGPSSEATLFGGFAPAANLKIAKVLDSGGNGISSNFIAGVEWCAAQAVVDIISASVSTVQASDGQDSTSIAVNCAADPTWSGTCGVIGGEPKITVIAAGNTGALPSSIGAPGAAELAITVGMAAEWSAGFASNWHDDGVYLVAGSSRGPVLQGGGPAYIKPDIVGTGSRVASAVPFATFGVANSYGIATGTSMATPSISGIIALMLQADSSLGMSGGTLATLPVNKVRDVLTLTAIDRGEPGMDNEWGAGFVDAFAAVSYATDPTQPLPSPTPSPTYTRMAGVTVPNDPGQWVHEFTIDASSVNIPMSAVVTIHGGKVCALGDYPFCFAEEWGPDIEARLDYFDPGLGAWGAPPPSAAFGPVTSSTCPLSTAPTNDGCGTWGRVETIHYTPDVTGLYRIVLFAFTGSPNNGSGGTADVEMTMGPIDGTSPLPNTPPVAGNDNAVTDEDVAAVGIDVLFNDTDADGDALSVTSLTQPANGSAVINGDETITYTPDPDFNGLDSFTYTANDGAANSNVATVEVTVNSINDLPIASFTFICTDLSCNFDALPGSTDPDGTITSYTWNFGDGNGDVGSTASHSFAADGTYNVSLTVFDNDGDFDAQLQPVAVNAGGTNTAPVVSITAPADGSTFTDSDTINFTGTASDSQDGDLTANLSWTSSIDGSIGSGGSVSTSTLSIGIHTITASVMDSGGLFGDDTITVTVNVTPPPNTAPTVSITNPGNGTTVTQGDSINFAGTASDGEDGDISANLSWDSDLDGAIGSGASLLTSALSVGTHLITASVTDSGGLTGDDQITVTVNPPPGATSVSVSAINYARKGGRNSDKHLDVTLTVVDNTGAPVDGAAVTITVTHGSGATMTNTKSTSGGTAVITWRNAPPPGGCFITVVDDVIASGLSWTAGDYPLFSHCD